MSQTIVALSPSGELTFGGQAGEIDTIGDTWFQAVVAGFMISQGSGLLALGLSNPPFKLSVQTVFWRDFSCLYLAALCRQPAHEAVVHGIITAPAEPELIRLLLAAPPMEGGEYLSVEILTGHWHGIDAYVCNEILKLKGGLAEWLEKKAPLWHQVGRVCFHLAENKNDPERPFAFLATYSPQLSKSGRVQYQPLGKALQEYAGDKNKKSLLKLLSPVQLASEKIDFVDALLTSGEIFHPQAWTPDEAYSLLENVVTLEESGLLVRLPDWWKKRQKATVSVTIGDKKQSFFGADAMLDFRVDLMLGDNKVSKAEWKKLMDAPNGLAYIKGQWVEIDGRKLSEALDHWKKIETEVESGGISFIEGMRLLAGAPTSLDAQADDELAHTWATVNAGTWMSGMMDELRDPGRLGLAAVDKAFKGTLRPYQEKGRDWLWFLSNLGLGACLADDMGLGKTVQVISTLLAWKKKRNSSACASLLVLPASLLSNWKSELARFAPSLKIAFVHASELPKKDIATLAKSKGNPFTKVDLVITTYAMLSRQQWLLDLQWQVVVLDEAQAIKNPGSRQTKAVKLLKSEARIALSGTPVENSLGDLWSLFDFLCPGLLGTTSIFKKYIKRLAEQENDGYAPLRNLVRPYILRRLKSDKSIISDLPDKTEVKTFCGLAKSQLALYAKSVDEFAMALKNVEDGMKRRGMVLAYLMRFKQICNHPSQYLSDGVYGADDSGKFERLAVLCEEIAARQEKVLIFTQFREMTEPISNFLKGIFGREGLVLHGGTAVKKRKALVDEFQSERGAPFFVLSLKAGGTGLNLTAASHVIHFDRWWNPAVENQATDRAFRIGQHRNVVVHKFICQGTIEEKTDKMIDEKKGLADSILKSDGAVASLTEIGNEALLKVVSLDIERARQ